jgi:Cu(I)/Ag(I) efflux system membrane fusion protein
MLEPRDVGIGISTDERIEIVSGLALGDTVVSSATFLVDAESNLGPLLGGMGNMPGMDFTAPTAPNAGARRAPGPAAPRPPKDTLKMKMPDPAGAHSGHTSPQRD